jgi:hypothetical protein
VAVALVNRGNHCAGAILASVTVADAREAERRFGELITAEAQQGHVPAVRRAPSFGAPTFLTPTPLQGGGCVAAGVRFLSVDV